MIAFRSIVCGVDFSEHSRHAIRWAAALAALYESRLTILTAVDPLLAHAARSRFDHDLVADSAQTLRKFAASALPSAWPWIPRYEVKAVAGEAPDTIRQQSMREHADLIVLGTQGLGGVRKFLLGSTTDRVLRSTKTSVLAVPLVDDGEVSWAGDRPPFAAKTILAATDFSAAANQAVAVAADCARAHGTALVIVHVVAPISVPSEARPYVGNVEEEMVLRGRTRLDQLAASHSEGLLPELVVTIGRPAEAIADLAKERAAGLIVLGLVGERCDASGRPGAIAYRVLCLAHAPVLVVPPQTNDV
jgi:nucleotide-binding universal stress UspA family protein